MCPPAVPPCCPGLALLFAQYEPDIAAGCPAYYLAASEERHELVLAVRGTYSASDVFTDLLATGTKFDGGSLHCHVGMGKAATLLESKYLSIIRPLFAQGEPEGP